MAFPASPTNGQEYTSGSGITYQWVSADSAWKKVSKPQPSATYIRTGSADGHSFAEKLQARQNIGFSDAIEIEDGAPANSMIIHANNKIELADHRMGLFKQTLHTSNGTHTYNANTQFAIVEVIGGGGASGGTDSVSVGLTDYSYGGGAAAYSMKLINVSGDGISSANITVGLGGVGVTTLLTIAANGTSSIYEDSETTMTAPGGGGARRSGEWAAYILNAGQNVPANQGVATGGTINTTGPDGYSGVGLGDNVHVTNRSMGGIGGHTKYGSGGGMTEGHGSIARANNGIDASGYGAGGGGSCCSHSGGPASGGDGSNGCILIWEYC